VFGSDGWGISPCCMESLVLEKGRVEQPVTQALIFALCEPRGFLSVLPSHRGLLWFVMCRVQKFVLLRNRNVIAQILGTELWKVAATECCKLLEAFLPMQPRDSRIPVHYFGRWYHRIL